MAYLSLDNDEWQVGSVANCLFSSGLNPGITPPLAGPRRFAAAESLRGQFPGQTCVEVVCASIANLQSLHSAATAKNKEPAFGLKAGSKRMSYSHSNLKLSYGGD